MNHIRNRWNHEYLTELREHHRCNQPEPTKQVRVGDVVLIEEKKLLRVRWKLGIVSELIRSKDGLI